MNILEDILFDLRKGSLTLVNQNIDKLNTYAQMFFEYGKNEKMLTDGQLTDLALLIRICNILYNCTDMNPLPIEDGVYDIILEYYRRFDPNFQVGSEVITFCNTQNDIIKSEKVNPFIEYTEEQVKKIEN